MWTSSDPMRIEFKAYRPLEHGPLMTYVTPITLANHLAAEFGL